MYTVTQFQLRNAEIVVLAAALWHHIAFSAGAGKVHGRRHEGLRVRAATSSRQKWQLAPLVVERAASSEPRRAGLSKRRGNSEGTGREDSASSRQQDYSLGIGCLPPRSVKCHRG